MGISKRAGFTIIETMLFLGITGLLIFGILGSTGSAVSKQRYRDSVSSLQAFLQNEYATVSNVYNSNSGTTPCGAQVSARGQSNCVILGRYITATPISGRSSKLLARTVIGTIPAGSPEVLNDVQVFTAAGNGSQAGYNIRVLPSTANDTIDYGVEWEANMVNPGSNVAMSFSALVLRSPASGYVKTFINPTSVISDGQLQSGLVSVAASLTQPLRICVIDYDRSTTVKRSVFINTGASSASGVELLTENTSGC